MCKLLARAQATGQHSNYASWALAYSPAFLLLSVVMWQHVTMCHVGLDCVVCREYVPKEPGAHPPVGEAEPRAMPPWMAGDTTYRDHYVPKVSQ
jgi:hypothetical protein